jgi:hypothetical protein
MAGSIRNGAMKQINALVDEKMKVLNCQRHEAFAKVIRENPALRDQLIEEDNAPQQTAPAAPVVNSVKLRIDALADEKARVFNMKRHDAFAAVLKENPDLRRQLIDESNGGHQGASIVNARSGGQFRRIMNVIRPSRVATV